MKHHIKSLLFLFCLFLGYTQMSQAQSKAPFTLVELPYGYDALEPAISARTMKLHHTKHHQGYVNKLNKLVKGTKYEQMSLADIVRKSKGGIFNNAGQNLNHILYFTAFKPYSQVAEQPTGDLLAAINKKFGSFAAFQQLFEKEGLSLFGSGWLWLATDKKGNLSIVKEKNAGNPVTKHLIPLLGIDVWEHAYYLDYENRRADHLKHLWNIINWQEIGQRYDARREPLKY